MCAKVHIVGGREKERKKRKRKKNGRKNGRTNKKSATNRRYTKTYTRKEESRLKVQAVNEKMRAQNSLFHFLFDLKLME